MKLFLIAFFLFTFSSTLYGQDKYNYYFLEIRTTGKAEVEITPEMGVYYPDIDSIVVKSRETKKNGAIIVTGVKYPSYSAAFNKLSASGLEYVQFVNLSTFGGGTALLAGEIKINYIIWRRKVH